MQTLENSPLRTKSAVDAIKFTVQKQSKAQMEPVVVQENTQVQEFTPEEQLACSIDNPDDCIACGS
jgi:ribonucleoside-diphosphate reductase alpha chain